MAMCILCGKTPKIGKNVPKSVHKTSRTLRPNLQKMDGIMMCTRCARTLRKYRTLKTA